MKEALRQWLLRHGFLDFQDGLAQCGVQGFEDLIILTADDLQELSTTLGLNLVMKRKFTNAVQDITTPKLEIQQLIRKLQINSQELVSTLQTHCALICGLATKVSEINMVGGSSRPTRDSKTASMKRQQSLKRSRSQHFFSKMDLDNLAQGGQSGTSKPVATQMGMDAGITDPAPAPAPAAPPVPVGPKPPLVTVLSVIPARNRIKVYIEPLTLEGVSYIINVKTPNGEENVESEDPAQLFIPDIEPGRSYRVKVAAKSALGVTGPWSESEPVAVPMQKETIVIIGGDVEYEENLDLTEYYVDTEKAWNHEPEIDLTNERTRLGCTAWRGNLISIGGSQKGMNHTNDVNMFNLGTKSWSRLAATKFVRHSHKVGVVDGKLFVVGGYGTRGTTNKRYRFLDVVEIYDSAEKAWVVHPERMNLPRKDFGCAVIDDEIFVAGGESNSRIIQDAEVFSFNTQKWIKIASMNTKRRQCGSCEYGGRFWVAGGFQGGSKKKSILVSVEMYDPHEDVWVVMAPLTEPRYGCSLQKMNDKLFCIGGYDTRHDPVDTIEVFDFESYCWRRWKTRLIKKRGSHESVVIEKWF